MSFSNSTGEMREKILILEYALWKCQTLSVLMFISVCTELNPIDT